MTLVGFGQTGDDNKINQKLRWAPNVVMMDTIMTIDDNDKKCKVNERFTFEDGPHGGQGGIPFTDGYKRWIHGSITAHEIRAKKEIDAIRARYGDTWGDWHGGTGGDFYEVTLNEGAYIYLVYGRSQDRTDSLKFISSDGASFGPYGGSGGEAWVASYPECKLAYLSGASQSRLDSLTLHFECETKDKSGLLDKIEKLDKIDELNQIDSGTKTLSIGVVNLEFKFLYFFYPIKKL